MTEDGRRKTEGGGLMKGERMGEERDSKRSHWVKIICVSISGLAIVVAAFIEVAHRYFPRDEKVAVERDREVPVPLLEKELSDANIYLSDTETNKVRGFLRHDLAYQALARDCLALLKGKQLVSPVPLDNINGFYEKMMGVAPDGYLRPDQYGDLKKLGRAIYEAWEEKQPGGAAGKRGGLRGILVGR